MALFGKLFEKKICSICEGEIGLLGNRKLEDGNLCKNCAAKLSPWMDDRRHSTVDAIREHLNYRAENEIRLASFNPTRTMGKRDKLMIDEATGTFIVTSDSNWREKNPDVISLSDVADARVDVTENKTEIKREIRKPDGSVERVSYVPPRYKILYTFTLRIELAESFPWFSKMRLSLNDSEVSIDTGAIPVGSVARNPVGMNVRPGMGGMLRSAAIDPRSNPKYCQCEKLGDEMCKALLSRRSGSAPEDGAPAFRPAGPAAQTERTCEYCGVSFKPDGTGCCPACGAPL